MARKSKTKLVTDGTNRIKAGLALRGHSLASWAKANGYPQPTVWMAVNQKRGGKRAIKIRHDLETFINA